MKKIFLSLIASLAILIASAQSFSCSGPSRYDAAFSTAQQSLELVTVNLERSQYMVMKSSSTAQFTSVEANIGFTACTKTPQFELYKAQVTKSSRTFTIPGASIPIQVIYPLGWSPDKRGQGVIKIKFTNGYLTTGEYILIDKTTLSADGAQMKGVAFSIK